MRTFLVVGLTAIVGAGIHAQSDRARAQYTVAYASFGPVATAFYVADADGSHERPLLEGSILDMNPSFTPDGRSVLFTSRRNGSADIYRVRIDGSGLERLTDDPAFDDQAVMSPNGRDIAFVSSRSGQADIWILDVTTRELRNLTNHPGWRLSPGLVARWGMDCLHLRSRIGWRAGRDAGTALFSPAQTHADLRRPCRWVGSASDHVRRALGRQRRLVKGRQRNRVLRGGGSRLAGDGP